MRKIKARHERASKVLASLRITQVKEQELALVFINNDV
jgi:hypothetical protein